RELGVGERPRERQEAGEKPGDEKPAGAADDARHLSGDDEDARPDHGADDDHHRVEKAHAARETAFGGLGGILRQEFRAHGCPSRKGNRCGALTATRLESPGKLSEAQYTARASRLPRLRAAPRTS